MASRKGSIKLIESEREVNSVRQSTSSAKFGDTRDEGSNTESDDAYVPPNK